MELEQAIQSVNELQVAVKEALTKTEPVAKKSIKKSSSKSAKEKKTKRKTNNTIDEGIEELEMPPKSDLIMAIQQHATYALQLAIESRSFVMFGTAVSIIYFFGDYASV